MEAQARHLRVHGLEEVEGAEEHHLWAAMAVAAEHHSWAAAEAEVGHPLMVEEEEVEEEDRQRREEEEQDELTAEEEGVVEERPRWGSWEAMAVVEERREKRQGFWRAEVAVQDLERVLEAE